MGSVFLTKEKELSIFKCWREQMKTALIVDTCMPTLYSLENILKEIGGFTGVFLALNVDRAREIAQRESKLALVICPAWINGLNGVQLIHSLGNCPAGTIVMVNCLDENAVAPYIHIANVAFSLTPPHISGIRSAYQELRTLGAV